MTPTEITKKLNNLKRIARFMDTGWGIPFTRFRFGADAVIGLVPGIGDLLSALVSVYILLEAKKLGTPNSILGKMAINIAIDTGIGAVPIFGDIFDAIFKSNIMNVDLLIDFLDKKYATMR